jgi:glutamine synthetase type III
VTTFINGYAKVAERHDLKVLLHEKPFKGVTVQENTITGHATDTG